MISCTRAQPDGDVRSDSNKTAFLLHLSNLHRKKYPSFGLCLKFRQRSVVQRSRPERNNYSAKEEMLDIRHLKPGHGIMVTLGLGLGSESGKSRVLLCKDER